MTQILRQTATKKSQRFAQDLAKDSRDSQNLRESKATQTMQDSAKNSRESHKLRESKNSKDSAQDLPNALQKYDDLTALFMERDCLEIAEFADLMGDFEVEFEIAKSLGIPLYTQNNAIFCDINKDIFDSTFCIVDIETTGFSPLSDEIIEIGAIKYRNGKILERFESYIFAPIVPPKITEITNITSEMIANAPSLSAVLRDFKVFLEEAIFMAHNIRFDFNFINEKLFLCNIPPMKNARICTLELARKTICAEKYGLGYLNEFLDINSAVRHRALADCEIAIKVFETSLLNLPPQVRSVRDLIRFSKGKVAK